MAHKARIKQFKQELANGTIVAEGKLPTFRSLAARYACSAATIKRMVDQLEFEGLLRTVRGAGTFVTARNASEERPRRRQIAAIVLDDQSQSELERQKELYLPLGWIFTMYNASIDAQSPEREKQFLSLVLAQEFEAVILEATPIAPTNADRFLQLRHQGTKVIHVSPYCDRMNHECYFMPDFLLAGQMGILRLCQAGYRRILFCLDGMDAPFAHLLEDGASGMARQLGMNFEVCRDRAPAAALLDRAAAGAGPAAIFCANDTHGAALLARRAGNLEWVGIGLLAACHSCQFTPTLSYFDFPYGELFSQAIGYATDPRRGALELEQRLFAPCFVDCGTL